MGEMALSKSQAAAKYRNALAQARAAAAVSLAGTIAEAFSITPMSSDAMDAWEKDWLPANDREPPNGGWDWPAVRERYAGEVGVFDTAVWSGDQLCGLAIGTINRTAVCIDAVEGSPCPHPLKGKVLPIIFQCAAMYAQNTGRRQIRLIEPVDGLIPLYRETYLFTVDKLPDGTPYCWRNVL
jgi:hypothetical protein